jgi:T5SS/PEP-CTERM-associated repeat protein
LLAAPPLLCADTIEWTNPVNGNFTTAANWTVTSGPGPAPPAAGDNAVFNEAGTYTVTLSAAPVASDVVQVSAGSVTFRENAGGGGGVYNINSGGADVFVLGAGSTLNLGLANDPAALNVGDEVRVSSGGTLNVNFGSDVSALELYIGDGGAVATSSLVVDGVGSTFNKNGIAAVVIGSNSASGILTFRNGASGDLNFTTSIASSNADSDGTLNVESDADLTLDTLNIASAGTFATASGTVTVTDAGSTITQTGASTLTIGTAAGNVGELNVENGGVYTTGTGAVAVQASGSLNIDAGTFELRGTLNNSGFMETRNMSTVRTGGANGSTVTINNSPAGEVQNFSGATTFALSSPTHVGVFNNQGLFDNDTSQATTTFEWQFNNTGEVDFAGTLNLNGGGTHTGSFEGLAQSSILRFGGGDHTFNGATFFVDPAGPGQATVRFSAGNSTFSTPTTIDGDVHISGGSIRGAAILTLPTLTWSGGRLAMNTTGGVTIPAGGSLTTLGGDEDLLIGGLAILQVSKLNIDGTATFSKDVRATGGLGQLAAINIDLDGQMDLNLGADFENDPNSGGVINNDGTMRLQESSHSFSSGWTVNNTGTVEITGTTGTTTFNGSFNNHQTTEVHTGSLLLSGGGAHTGHFDVAADANLRFFEGVHIINGADFSGEGSVANRGEMSFGSSSQNPTIHLDGVSIFNLPVSIFSGTFNNNVDTMFAAGATLFAGTLAGAGDLTFDGEWLSTKIFMKNAARVTMSGLLNGNLDREVGSSDAGGTVTLAIKANGSLTTAGLADVVAAGAAGSVTVLEIPSTSSVELLHKDIDFRTASPAVTGIVSNAGLLTINGQGGPVSPNQIAEGWTVNNTGTLRIKNNSALSFGFAASHGVLNNVGTLEVQNGSLQIVAGASSGLFDVDAGGIVTARNHQFNAATFTNDGQITLQGGNIFSAATTIGGKLIVEGANTFNAAAFLTGAVELNAGGSLLGTGQVTVNDLAWRAGAIGLPNGLVVAPDGLLRIQNSSSLALANAATLTLSSGAVLFDQGAGSFNLRTESDAPVTVNVQPGATVDLTGGNLSRLNPTNAGNFNNAGFLRKSGASNITWGAGWEFNNTGLVLLQGGLTSFTDVINTGDFFLVGGDVFISQTGFVNAGYFQIGGGDLLTVTTGSWTNNGNVFLQGNNPAVQGQLINNSGQISINAATSAQVNASFSNAAAGQILIHDSTANFAGLSNTSAGRITVDDSTATFNALVTSAVGGEISAIESTLNFTNGLVNNGTLNLINSTVNGPVAATGNIALAGASTFNGAVIGPAHFTGGGSVAFAGSYAPGNSPAEVHFDGNITFANSNHVLMEIAGTALGTQYDSLQIDGQASLDGQLTVSLINGFTPAGGDLFELLQAQQGVFNQFDVVNLPALPAGLEWNVVYSNFQVLIEVSPIFEADFDEDGDVDSADLAQWGDGFGTAMPAQHADGDADGDADVDGGDFLTWQRQFGSLAPEPSVGIPEPCSEVLDLGVLGLLTARKRRRV